MEITNNKKCCNKCKTLKDSTQFHKNKSCKDGLYSLCKSCKSLTTKIQKKNRGKEFLDKHAEWQRNYRSRDPERDKKNWREWSYKNRDKLNAKQSIRETTKLQAI